MYAMTESTMVKVIVFSVSSVLVLRVVMEMVLRSNFSRKGHKKYKENTCFFDRWFFISARCIVRDKYSKLEGRIIRHTISMQIIFVLNLVLHVGLLAEVALLFMAGKLKMLNDQIADRTATVFFLLILAAVAVLYFIESYENRKYHQMREKRK